MPQSMPGHVEWLATHRAQALGGALRLNGVELGLDDALRTLMAADPSPGHRATQWLCDTYISGGYRWEDLQGGATSKVAETLALFAQARAHLLRPNRNLDSYATLGQVWLAAQSHVQVDDGGTELTLGGRALRRQARTQAYQQSLVLCHRPDLIVTVPTTRQAACWWGQGTRWCTASLRNNMFEHYNEKAPLIVVVFPDLDGTKLQLHLDDGEVQFMDAADCNLELSFVHEHWSRFEPIMHWLAGQGADIRGLVPEGMRKGDLAMAMVGANGYWLHNIAPCHRSREVCLRALSSYGMGLEHVPRVLRDAVMCRTAVEQNGAALAHVPANLVTHELCMLAVSNSATAIAHVPRRLQGCELAMAAVTTGGRALEYIHKEHRWPELYAAAVRSDGRMLRHVPPDLKTPGMYMDAVCSWPQMLETIPRSQWTPELLLAAVQQDGTAICHIKAPYLNEALCMAAVQQDGNALAYIPKDMRTPQVCAQAVEGASGMLLHVPRHCISYQICQTAVRASGYAVADVPHEYMDHDLCMLAAQSGEFVLSYIPYKLWTREIVVETLVNHSWYLTEERAQFLGDSGLLGLVERAPMVLEYVPAEFQTLQMCLVSVCEMPDMLAHVCPCLLADVQAALADMPDMSRPAHTKVWGLSDALDSLARHLAPDGIECMQGQDMDEPTPGMS